jgi:hypothetical protein
MIIPQPSSAAIGYKLFSLLKQQIGAQNFKDDHELQTVMTRTKISYNKPTKCTNFSIYFWNENLNISDNFSVHHQEFFHCTHSNGVCYTGLLTACKQDQDGTAFHQPHVQQPSTYKKPEASSAVLGS